MSDRDSFDPLSWSKRDGSSPVLPEMWKNVAGRQEAGEPEAGGLPRVWWLLAGCIALVAILGSLWFWLPRSPQNSAPLPEQVQIAPLPDGATAPPQTGLPIYSSRRVRLAGPKDLLGYLREAGLPADEIAEANKVAMSVLGNAKGETSAVLNLVAAGGTVRLERLEASLPDGSGAILARGDDGAFSVSRVAAELSKRIKVVRGELDSDSFYSSAVSAGVIDSLIPEFVNAFGFDFNLAAEVAPGDTFEVAYEQTVNAAGQPQGEPQLLFASLVTAAKSRSLYRFKPVDQDTGWFDGNGGSTVRSFMRTPVDGARITSKFGMRFHPVLHYTRLHAGVDFGVPVGTPVYAAADGMVIGSTPTSCGGNMAVLQHDNGWVTRYFHLSHFAPGLHNGQRVTQGYTIGLSGTTGTCTTGPHLHYEVRIDGEPVDPLGIQTDSGRKGLEGAARAAFIQQRDRVDVARARNAE